MDDAIVLAGGRGTRLQSVVADRPKPLAEVAGRPFLHWLLFYLRGQGLQHVVMATGYRGEMVRAACGDGSAFGLRLSYAQEESALGTGGAAHLALEATSSAQVLVLNGDSFCPFTLAHLAAFHQGRGAQATLWLVAMDDCRRFGTVECGPNGQVSAFREKSPARVAGLINAGIYLFDRQVLAALPGGQPLSLESEVFPQLVGQGLYAIPGPAPFLDIGTPESYARATTFILENRTLWSSAL